MKRVLQIALALAAVFMLSVPALAADPDQFWITNADGERVFDYGAYDFAVAQEMVQAAEVDVDPWAYFFVDGCINRFDNIAFNAALDAAVAAKNQPQKEPVSKPDESAGMNDEQSALPDDNSSGNGKYPVGSYVDEAGNVFSADGELLSPGSTPAREPVGDSAVPGDVLDTPDASETGPVEAEPPVYRVSDMRSGADTAGPAAVGLKALVISIFGEYTPVMTTAAVTETVGNETTTTLIDTVADGAAGVDYEWCAGVFLFGILLFCLMKLLGGVLK